MRAQGLSGSKRHYLPAHLRFPDLLPQPLQQHDPHQGGAPTCGRRARRRCYLRSSRGSPPLFAARATGALVQLGANGSLERGSIRHPRNVLAADNVERLVALSQQVH